MGTLRMSLEGVIVQGDVRISLFEDKGKGFDAHKAMTSVPNAHLAKGLVFLFLFHTAFMDMDDNNGNAPNESSAATEGNGRRYQVSVANLDKANNRVKKGRHPSTSSVSLSYNFTDINGVIQDPSGQHVGPDFSGGMVRESGTVTGAQPGRSTRTNGEAVEGCTIGEPQIRKAGDASSAARDMADNTCDETWYDDTWLHIAPAEEDDRWHGAECVIEFDLATKLPAPPEPAPKDWAVDSDVPSRPA